MKSKHQKHLILFLTTLILGALQFALAHGGGASGGGGLPGG